MITHYMDAYMAILGGLAVKNLPTTQEIQVWSLGWEDPLEGHANPVQYSCMENPVDIRTIGLQGVRHDWSNWAYRHTCACISRWIKASYLSSPDIVLSVPVNLQQSPGLMVRLVHLFPGTLTWIWLDGIVWITWGQSWERRAICRLDTCITCANI